MMGAQQLAQLISGQPPQQTGGQPLFTQEGPQYYGAAFAHNQPSATRGPYQTQLSPDEETQFRQWVKQKQVPFDPGVATQDYDMRGYWKAQQSGLEKPWKGSGAHFPDTYKTPYDTSFSGESKYAQPGTPWAWHGDDLIDTRTGQIVFRSSKEIQKLMGNP